MTTEERLKEIAFKKRFAEEYIACGNATEAAKKVFGDNVSMAVIAGVKWIKDPEVMQFIEEYGDVGDDADLSLDSQCKRYLEIYNRTQNVKDKISALNSIDRIKGYDKPSVSNVTVNNNKVMIVPRCGSDEEWEKKAVEQQKMLMQDDIVVVSEDVSK